jgi:hypothetical protein
MDRKKIAEERIERLRSYIKEAEQSRDALLLKHAVRMSEIVAITYQEVSGWQKMLDSAESHLAKLTVRSE